jgi:hypothetical protein
MADPMDQRTKGAWVVSHSSKLQQVTTVEFEPIQVAGKAGALLSALAGSDQAVIPMTEVYALARASNISARLELPSLLGTLSQHRLVSTGTDAVEVLGVTSRAVLEHTASIFDGLEPSANDLAALELAERASATPLEADHATELLSDTFRLPANESTELLAQAAEIGFVDSEKVDDSRTLYFNGNVFRRDTAAKMHAVMASLSGDDLRKVSEIEAALRQRGCISLDEVQGVLGEPLLRKLHSIGMYDVNEVSNDAETVAYVTHPAAFGKFGDPFADDALDLAKAFVTCLTYGMTRSSTHRGKITMLTALLNKLLRGDWVGPATAIGKDYRVLELKGVIKLRAESAGMYSMKLLKRDIGELALNVLTVGDVSGQTLPIPGASVSQYTGPEATRSVRRRNQATRSRKATAELLLALRTRRT